jgi:excisionase family DNA binding protein
VPVFEPPAPDPTVELLRRLEGVLTRLEAFDDKQRAKVEAAGRKMPEPLYSVAEVAEAWDCSTGHVYTLISQGELTYLDIGAKGSQRAKSRIPASSVAAYVKKYSIRQPLRRGRA